jgi:hypothetical protein
MSESEELTPALPPQERLLHEKLDALATAIDRMAIPRGPEMPWGDDPNPLLWVFNAIMPNSSRVPAPVIVDDPSNKRSVLQAMGESRVRRALANGELVQHLVQPAHEWLDEIESKGNSDAIDQGQQPRRDVIEHQDGDGGGQAAEAGGSDSVSGGGEGQHGDPA